MFVVTTTPSPLIPVEQPTNTTASAARKGVTFFTRIPVIFICVDILTANSLLGCKRPGDCLRNDAECFHQQNGSDVFGANPERGLVVLVRGRDPKTDDTVLQMLSFRDPNLVYPISCCNLNKGLVYVASKYARKVLTRDQSSVI